MTKANLGCFRDALQLKQTELAFGSRTRENIAIERSAYALEEVAFKSARKIAVAQRHRQSVILRNVGWRRNGSTTKRLASAYTVGAKSLIEDSKPYRAQFCIVCQEAADSGDESVLSDESVLRSIEPKLLGAA